MRTYALAIAAAILFAFPLSAYSRPIPVAPGDTDPPVSQGRSVAQPDDCYLLQQACLDDDERGYQGNCARFRSICGPGWIHRR
jgi:hypothetical protein